MRTTNVQFNIFLLLRKKLFCGTIKYRMDKRHHHRVKAATISTKMITKRTTHALNTIRMKQQQQQNTEQRKKNESKNEKN